MTVASLATITQVVPSIRPMPVTIPAPGASSSYRPVAASGLSSRNAEPGSSRRSIRSRTGSLPRSRWRAIERSSPPAPRSATAAWRARRSSTRAAIASWLARASGGRGIEPAAQDGHVRDDRSRALGLDAGGWYRDDVYVIRRIEPCRWRDGWSVQARRRAGLTQRAACGEVRASRRRRSPASNGAGWTRGSARSTACSKPAASASRSMPRLGIGVDRTQIRALLRLTPIRTTGASRSRTISTSSSCVGPSDESPNERAPAPPSRPDPSGRCSTRVSGSCSSAGLAAQVHGSPSLTGDVDICFALDGDNLDRLAAALDVARVRSAAACPSRRLRRRLDARALRAGDVFTLDHAVRRSRPPRPPGSRPRLRRRCIEPSITAEILGDEVRVASLDDLMAMKRAAGRPKDRIELEILGALARGARSSATEVQPRRLRQAPGPPRGRCADGQAPPTPMPCDRARAADAATGNSADGAVMPCRSTGRARQVGCRPAPRRRPHGRRSSRGWPADAPASAQATRRCDTRSSRDRRTSVDGLMRCRTAGPADQLATMTCE